MLQHKFRQLSVVILMSWLPALAQQASHQPLPPAANPTAQVAPKGAEAAPATSSAPAVPAEAPVITIKNLCSGQAASSAAGCTTTITKEQFEQLLNAVVPKARRAELPNGMRQNMARQLGQLMVMVQAAEKRGLEKDPEVQQRIKLQRDSALAQALTMKMQDEAAPTDAEVEKYYKDNASAFEEVTLQRLFIPKGVASKEKPVDEKAQKAAAEKLQARAAAGEDFDKLQKEAYAGNGNPQSAPNTQMGGRRRGGLPPDQEAAVFALQQNGISQLFDSPAGWMVYKVIGKRTVPLTEVKDEITRKLQQQKFTDERNALTSSAPITLNEAYFGKEEAPSMPGMGGMGGMPMNVHRVPEQPAAATPAAKKPAKPKSQAPPPPQ